MYIAKNLIFVDMDYEWQDISAVEEAHADGHIPQGCLDAQRMLDRFVEINYETARYAIMVNTTDIQDSANHIRHQIIDIIRNNPPLDSLPRYFRDGRENYLWYSDFYDDATNDVFGSYKQFTVPQTEITPANYATELAKIDLPYFKELVNLVSLEKLCIDLGEHISQPEPEPMDDAALQQPIQPQPQAIVEQPKKKRLTGKRSYNPDIIDKHYLLLAECVNTINLFRRPVTAGQIKKLMKGRLPEPLQVTNQKSLAYFFDQLAENKFIKDTWISVADKNKDFISFRQDNGVSKYITTQKLSNCRKRNEGQYIKGLEAIDEMIELVLECRNR